MRLGGLVSELFSEMLKNALVDALHQFDEQVGEISARRSAQGSYQSGATLIEIEKAMRSGIRNFASRLVDLLTQYEVEHSPIDEADFDDATESLTRLVAAMENGFMQVQRRINGSKEGGRLPLSQEKIDTALKEAKLSLQGHKLVFHSKRSFWKWAWGDTRKRVFTGLVALAGALVLACIRWVWSLVQGS